MRELARSFRHAAVTRSAADVPVLPAVIAANGDALASGVSTRDANCTRGRIRSVLAKANHLGARNHRANELGNFSFEWMRERKNDAVVELLAHGLRHVRI